MRDEFPPAVKDILAKRVAFRCSNPSCRKPTSGPQHDQSKSINIGVAAHITAASPDGPRYDPTLTSEARASGTNGIWLCQSCAKLVDNDPTRYSIEGLTRWKTISETAALRSVESNREGEDDELMFLRLEGLLPDLLDEMRSDLSEHPLFREFVPLKKVWSYCFSGNELVYYYEDHADLDSKLRILENHYLIRDISPDENNKRYVFTEAFARYLGV